MLGLLTLSRLALVAWQWQRVIDADMLANIFIQGLRFDMVMVGIVMLFPTLLLLPLATSRPLLKVWKVFLTFYLPTVAVLLTFME